VNIIFFLRQFCLFQFQFVGTNYTRSISGSLRNTPIRDDVSKDLIVDDASTIQINPKDEDEEVITPFPKRKRPSINYNMDDLGFDGIRGSPNVTGPIVKRSKLVSKPIIRGVVIGVWRDSSEANDADKHVIYGFIDVHDRLRTRIYGMNRQRKEISGNLPTGAGGCWVTFPKIIFDDHLKDLSPAQVKEYVKYRVQDPEEPLSEERSEELDASAVARAKAAVTDGTASPGGKPIVHRPSGRKSSSRQSLPPQTVYKTPSFQAINVVDQQAPKGSFYDGKPSGVLLGYWADSDSQLVEDKHTVYGVLTGSGSFRFKVQRVTRDGRYVNGNFPIGAGAMWVAYDKVVFEPHLAGLTKPEIKQYGCIRLLDQSEGEADEEREANEMKAIAKAKAMVAGDGPNNKTSAQKAPLPPLEMETRFSARAEQKAQAKQQAEAGAELEKTRKQKTEASVRQPQKTRKEISMDETSIQGAARHELNSNIRKLNQIWETQSATISQSPAAAPALSEEVKYHHGIKYERKQTGFLQGKLVSPAQVLTIDGEDYIEYRILTKPAF
jgi:hypothetical protein